MSSDFIYRMAVVRLSPEVTGDYDDNFLWLIEAGSSNCWEAGNRRRARDWQCGAIGQHYSVVQTVCEWAGSCEGGMVKYPGGRDCTPERLIRAYRNSEAKAFNGFAEAAAAGFQLTPRLIFGKTRDKHEQERYGELVKAGKHSVKADGRETFAFDPSDKADMELWLKHCKGTAWAHLEVVGPGEIAYAD